MTFNVQNLFDNVDDAGKDDKAYLPIGAKQNDAHIRECNEIELAGRVPARKSVVEHARYWGNGWYILPNHMHGS